MAINELVFKCPAEGAYYTSTSMEHHFNSACVHAGYTSEDAGQNHNALSPPVYHTSTFIFDSALDIREAFAGNRNLHIYSRLSNPTNDVAEKRIAELEAGEAAVLTASGMGAITSTFWTFLKSGDHVICSNQIYGCTFAYMNHVLPRFGVDVSFVDTSNLDEIQAAFRPETKILYFETIANPVCRLTDIEAAAKIAHNTNPDCRVIVDNTFASPYICRPLTLGADIVVHSLTKIMVGMGTCLSGVVVGKAADVQQVRMVGVKDATGAVCDPGVAFNVINGLKTLHVRAQRHSENAQKVAEFLQPYIGNGIDVIHCATLPSSPAYELAKKQLRSACLMVAFEFTGGLETAEKFMDSLRFCKRAVSLGDAETLVCCPSVTTHATYTREERQRYGIADGLTRISVGLEDVEDIIADIKQAIEKALA